MVARARCRRCALPARLLAATRPCRCSVQRPPGRTARCRGRLSTAQRRGVRRPNSGRPRLRIGGQLIGVAPARRARSPRRSGAGSAGGNAAEADHGADAAQRVQADVGGDLHIRIAKYGR
jgi:hypothetical protein